MSKAERTTGAQPKNDPPTPLDKVFSALEERVERLSGRLAELTEENRRLRSGLEEAEAARDRLKAELTESLERLLERAGEIPVRYERKARLLRAGRAPPAPARSPLEPPGGP